MSCNYTLMLILKNYEDLQHWIHSDSKKPIKVCDQTLRAGFANVKISLYVCK